MKTYFCISSCIFLASLFSMQLSSPTTEARQTNTSIRPAILCDLHGVLFKLDIPAVIKTVYQDLPKSLLLKYLTLRLPQLSYHFYKIYAEKKSAEYIIAQLGCTFSDLKPYIPVMHKLANCQYPVPAVWNIMENLKKNGHQVYLFSDIGENLYKTLSERHPQLFSIFTDRYISNAADGWIKKPNPQVYAAMKKIVTLHNTELPPLIFVDDSPSKIVGGEQASIKGILFSSPEQLAQDLSTILQAKT